MLSGKYLKIYRVQRCIEKRTLCLDVPLGKSSQEHSYVSLIPPRYVSSVNWYKALLVIITKTRFDKTILYWTIVDILDFVQLTGSGFLVPEKQEMVMNKLNNIVGKNMDELKQILELLCKITQLISIDNEIPYWGRLLEKRGYNKRQRERAYFLTFARVIAE